jgi:urea transport system ATP-binding protein
MAKTHAVLVVEHDMEFVRQTAGKVTVLHEGTVLCEGAMDKVQRDPRVIEVYLGRGYHTDAHDSGAQRRLWGKPDPVER